MASSRWTPPRSLTFYTRMRMTFFMSWRHLKQWAGWMVVVWSNGATVSFSRTHRLKGKGVTVTNGKQRVTYRVTPKDGRVTPM